MSSTESERKFESIPGTLWAGAILFRDPDGGLGCWPILLRAVSHAEAEGKCLLTARRIAEEGSFEVLYSAVAPTTEDLAVHDPASAKITLKPRSKKENP